MRHTALAIASAFSLFLAAPASAQSTPPDSTIHRHLGFLVRPYLGFGYLSSTIPAAGGDLTLSGAAGQFGVVVGGAVSENFILGGEFYVTAVGNPSASRNGVSQTLNDSSFGNLGFGPNLTYYFMPANIYLSLTPALTKVTFTQSGVGSSSDWGFGGRAAVGKEWWVSDHWGLGVAGQFTYSTNANGTGSGSNVSAWGAGAVFSATYN